MGLEEGPALTGAGLFRFLRGELRAGELTAAWVCWERLVGEAMTADAMVERSVLWRELCLVLPGNERL